MSKKYIKDFFSDIKKSKFNNWKWHLKNVISSPDVLMTIFPLIDKESIKKVLKQSKMQITPHFLSLINRTRNLALLKQVLPDKRELEDNYDVDPFNERSNIPVKNLIQRYKDRVVVLTTNLCAGYCRYCTRKWNWGNNFFIKKSEIKDIVNYLTQNKSIREVIISGGEPFLLSQKIFDYLLLSISKIPHIEVIRIGTRILTYLPQRIDDKIVSTLSKIKPVWIMTHFNHPDEIVNITIKAINKLIDAGCVLCNQTVLLKEVNDNYETLKALFYKLTALRIKPYYLFQCDKVKGTKYFYVSIKKGLYLIEKLRKNISGLSVPEYVIDTKNYGKLRVTRELIKK